MSASYQRSGGPSSPAGASHPEVVRALRVLFEPGDVVEVRIPNHPRSQATTSGYFNDFDKLAQAALAYSGRCPAVYITLQRIKPALLNRANNRMVEWSKQTTADADVLRRRWFNLDLDAVRPAGISSTDAEHAAALDRLAAVRDALAARGWPDGVGGDSGNGAHGLWAVDLPNDPESRALLERCLQALAWEFTDQLVTVDVKVFNAARIWKLYGTVVAKGDATPDRPHRTARLLSVPDPIRPVPRELLEALAARAPRIDAGHPGRNGKAGAGQGPFDLASWIREHGLAVARAGPWQGGYRWILNPCPWNDAHTDRSAYVVQLENGAIGAGCHHDGCQGRKWQDLRDLFEPGAPGARAHASANGKAGADAGDADRRDAPVLRTLAEVRPEPVEWLWKPWVPRGALTILDGDPGLGKSCLMTDVAARVSRGWAMPPGGGVVVGEPGAVLLLTAEDSLARTVRPRLDLAGADASRVYALEAVRCGGDERPPVLPWDLDLVEGLIGARGVVLIVIDPFLAYLDGQLDAHRDQDVRRCMHRLKRLAERTGAAIVLIRHLNKLLQGPAIYRGGGSIGISGAVRSALLVGRHPSAVGQFVLAPVKCNLARPPRALAYSLDSVGDVARVAWGAEVDLVADEILGHHGGGRGPTMGERCADAIRDFLAGGPKPVAELEAAMKLMGYSERAVKEGRRAAGVKVRRVGYGAEGAWMAMLPEPSPEAGDGDDAWPEGRE